MNNNIPFEYVTERDLEAGLAARYNIIYLPYVIALSEQTIESLMDYVKEGGILMADFPVLMLDTYGRLNKQFKGSDFEKLFGFQVRDYYHSFNSPKKYRGIQLNTQFGDVEMTHGEVLESFPDGYPALIQSEYGEGKTIVFNFEASRLLFRPGNSKLEDLVADQIHEASSMPFYTSGDINSMVYRRSAPEADHYFIVNSGDSEIVTVNGFFEDYENVMELLEDKELKINNNSFMVDVPARSALWVRCEK